MQKKYVYRIVKIVILGIALLAVLFVLQNILRHKCIYRLDETPESEMWQEFYSLDKNSLDIVFLGNSHVYNGINPAVFYEETGIKGFDMATSNQDLFVSYYILKEMLKTQSPEVVVLDTYALHLSLTPQEEQLRSTYYKMAFDSMKLSSNKVKAVREWKTLKDDINVVERLFPIFEYHSRWEELNETDFSDTAMRTVNLGHAYAFKTIEGVELEGYDMYEEPVDPTGQSREYFDRIVRLLSENNVTLVLVSLPEAGSDPGENAANGALADENGLWFINYNEASRLRSLDLDCEKDLRDASHLNALGADKLTRALAKDLTALNVITSREKNDTYYNGKVSLNERVMLNRSISDIENFEEYIETVRDNGYVVLVSANGEAFEGLSDEYKAYFGPLFANDISDSWGRSFIGVIEPGTSFSLLDTGRLCYASSLKNGTGYSIESIGYYAASDGEYFPYASIVIDNVEYAENEEGLNFVIYDPLTEQVIDHCVFVTTMEEKPVYRTFYYLH